MFSCRFYILINKFKKILKIYCISTALINTIEIKNLFFGILISCQCLNVVYDLTFDSEQLGSMQFFLVLSVYIGFCEEKEFNIFLNKSKNPIFYNVFLQCISQADGWAKLQ